MSNTIKIKRGTNLSNAGTPAAGELIYKSDTNQLFVGDGSTAATGLSPIGGSASGDIEGVTAGVGLSGGGGTGTVTLTVDLSELTDMTQAVNSSQDELIILDNGADRRKLISEIPLSAFNNDSGFITTDTTLSTEAVQDIVGAMFSSNTETRVAATYDDTNGKINVVVDDMTANDNTQLSTEQVQDIVGAMFSSNTETRISVSYQDGDGTIDLVVDDMTADNNTVTTNIAGTGIDVSSGTGNSTISVDVSDFMTNGVNNRVLTATGTDGINAESSLTFSGTQLTNTGDIKIASGSLGVNTNAPTGDGRIKATSFITAGSGSGGVALTHNDGYGNANVTFNHEAGTPEQNGQSARIEVNTDATSSEALMSFETSAADMTSGSAQGLTESFKIAHDYLEMPYRLRHMGDTNTYIQYDADRIYLVAGGTTKYDSNNGNVIATGDILDQDNMSSNSATAVASQQSIKAYVDAEVAGVVNSAPAALNTLDELAAALGDDANFATTTSTSLGNRLRVDTASQGLTGTQQANAITNLGITATKAELNYVDGVTSNIQTQLNGKLSTSGTAANSTLLGNLGQGSFLRSDAVDTASGKITFTNGMQDNVSNVGSVGGTGLEGDQLSTTDWANLPVGFGGMMRSGNQSYGNPGSNYFLFHKIANRDSGGGWGGIAVGYNSNADFYVGHTTVSSSYATWSKVWNEANDGAGSGLDADTLDGSHASAFLTSVPNHSGNLITSGTIASARLDADTAHLSTTQTFSGAKTFSDSVRITGSTKYLYIDNDAENESGIWLRDNQDPNGQYGKILFNSNGSTNALNFYVQSGTAALQLSSTVSTSPVKKITSGDDFVLGELTNNLRMKGNGTTGFNFLNSGNGWAHLNCGNLVAAGSLDIAGDIDVDGTLETDALTINGTTSVAFTSSDHSKLDGIEASATADQTAAQILTAIKTVDGGGSGLDADTVDGIQASGFTRAGVESGTPNTAANKTTFTCNDAIETSSGNQSGLQVWQDTAGADAFMTFHVAGDFAGYFGLDGSTNDLAVGGWSYGNGNKYRIWHAGNDGAGSGLDADTLDGLQLETSGRNDNANKVVRTNSNGYLMAGWINTPSGNTTNASTDYYVNTNDGYIRKKTLANVRTEIMGVSAGTSFLRSDAADTASGAITFTGRTTFDDSGADGVLFKASDNASNSSRVFFDGTSTSCIFQEGNDLSFRINATTGSSSGTERMYIREAGMALSNSSLGVNASVNGTNGMIHASNDIVAFASDKRLKENIRPIENALDKVSKLSGFVYNWNELANEKAEYDMDKDYVGVYAQDVEEVQPEAVDLAPFDNDGKDNSISGEKYLTVKYDKLVPLLIESIKELKAEIEELKK